MNVSDFETCDIADMVAVGATGAASVRFWVRTTVPGAHQLELWSAHDRRAAQLVLLPEAGADCTATFAYPRDVPGGAVLEPATRYEYRLTRDGQVLGEGRFETAPLGSADCAQRFSFAFMSCHQPFDAKGNLDHKSLRMLDTVCEALDEQDVKRVFFMGDQMYADLPKRCSLFDSTFFSRVGPASRKDIWDCTREEVRGLYQRRYRAFWSLPKFRALLANYPCQAIMDDHELKDNFGSSPEHARQKWSAVRDGALDAFADYQGGLVHARGNERPPFFDYQLTYADVALYCLDLRSQRRNDGEVLEICSPVQLGRLEQFLADNVDKQVVMVILSVPLMVFPGWVAALGMELAGESSDAADRWSSPKAAPSRERLTSLLFKNQKQNPAQRTILLGGDIHVGCAVQFEWREQGVRPMYQLVSSAVSNLSDVLTRQLARLATSLESEVTGDDGGEWAKCRMLRGVPGADKNPYEQLNVGIVQMTRRPSGGLDVQLKLLSHDGNDPAGPSTVYCSEVL